MSRKAIDVVLLPDEAMTNRAIEINAELVGKFGDKIVLNKTNCLPHISLAMGCLEETDIASVEKVLEAIAKETSPDNLKVVGIQSSGNSKGQAVSVFEVEKTTQLQLLHEQTCNIFNPRRNRRYDMWRRGCCTVDPDVDQELSPKLKFRELFPSYNNWLRPNGIPDATGNFCCFETCFMPSGKSLHLQEDSCLN